MILPVFLPHLGCGKRCAYCDQGLITGTPGNNPLPFDRIPALFETLKEPAEVALYSGNILGLDPPALEQLFSIFLPYRDKITHFRISAKPGPLTPEIIDILKTRNVRTIELGMPSFNNHILALLDRGHTREDSFDAYALLRDHGFEMGIQVMVGLPEETPDDIRETVSAVAGLRPSFIRVYPLVVIEGTRLFRSYGEGSFTPDDLDTAVAKAAFIYTSAWELGIKTIKMGLTESDVLKGSVAAGPFHPAFGYLVKSEVYRLAVQRVSEDARLVGSDVVVRLHGSDVAHLTGHRRSNMARLRDKSIGVSWVVDPALEQGRFRIEGIGRSAEGSLTDALAMIPF